MRVSRRELLAAVAWAPAGFLAASAVTSAGRLASRAAAAVRPAARGTTASLCAACGAGDHAMLDPRCPAARRVR